jgi:hypothetical protein
MIKGALHPPPKGVAGLFVNRTRPAVGFGHAASIPDAVMPPQTRL